MKLPSHHHHLRLLLLLSILLLSDTFPTTLAQTTSPAPPGPPAGPILIGSLRSCAHNLSGEVYIKNANQIEIKNFTYDGLGTKAWFHVMTPKALSIHAALPNTFFPVSASPDNGTCVGLNKSYSQEDLTLTLPLGHPALKNLTIIQIKSFGVFSYGKSGDCSNYGNVYFVHKWRDLFKIAATGGLGPPVNPVAPCLPPILPDLSNPEFCHPGKVKFRDFFGKCVEQYGAVPKSGGGALAFPVEIFWGRSFFIFLIAYLGIFMTADLQLSFS